MATVQRSCPWAEERDLSCQCCHHSPRCWRTAWTQSTCSHRHAVNKRSFSSLKSVKTVRIKNFWPDLFEDDNIPEDDQITWQSDAHNPSSSLKPAACYTYPTWILHKVEAFFCPTKTNEPLVHGWWSERQNNPLTVPGVFRSSTLTSSRCSCEKREVLCSYETKKERNKTIVILIKQ